MANKFSGKLSAFIREDSEDSLDNSLANSSERVSTSKILSLRDNNVADEDEAPRKRTKKKSFEDKLLEMDRGISRINGATDYQVFDAYFDEYADSDEDTELKNSLISQGRKYARDTKSTTQSSEVAKVFSGNDKDLNKMLSDIDADLIAIQRDIDNLRSMRTGRNNKALTDFQMNKKELFNTKLSIIKAQAGLHKDMFDIQTKINREKQSSGGDNGDPDMLINRAIGNMFGSGRSAALGTVGGYSGVSGAIGADKSAEYENEYDDEETVDDTTCNIEEPPGGERAYLKYENAGAHLIVTEHEDHSYSVHAEDRDGNVLSDYPLPPNADHLSFEVNERFGTARDDYHRKYTYRKDY